MCGSLMASYPGIIGEVIPQDVAFLPPTLEGVGHLISLEAVQLAFCPRYWGEGVPLGAWVRVPGLLCRLVAHQLTSIYLRFDLMGLVHGSVPWPGNFLEGGIRAIILLIYLGIT